MSTGAAGLAAEVPETDESRPASVAAGSSGARGRRLPVYFGLLVGLVALAAAAAVGYVFVQTDRDSRRTAESDARFAAVTAAKQLDDGIALLRATVTGIAATPQIEQAASQPACTLTFGLGDLSRGHVEVLRPDGSVACSSRPRTGTAPLAGYAESEWLTTSKTGSVFLAPILDSATGDRSVLSAAPTPEGWVVVAFVALEPLGPSLARLYGGAQPVEFLLTSGDGKTVLARSIEPGRWIGSTLEGSEFASTGGPSERRDLDGEPRLYAQSAVPTAGWKLYAGEEKAAALAAGNTLRERQLLIILVGLAIVLLATLAVYRRVAVPIRRLGAAVRSSSALNPPVAVPVSGPAEVSGLGDDINALISSVRDELSRRQEAEQVVLSSERSYRQLFESSPLPMWIHDSESLEILAANAAAVGRYGYSRQEFLALKLTELAPSGADPGDASQVAAGDLTELSRHLAKDGSEIKVRTLAHPVVFEGRPAQCVVAEDIGERERLESQLRQAQKMEAIGHLASGVAHDFNNLLTVITGYGGMARNRIGAGPGGRELAEIERAAERATQLTEQLLAFSRQQLLEPTLLDLNEVATAVTPMLARLIGDDIEIAVLGDQDTPPVLADRGQLEQVIVNLAVNARDAMPDGGTLTIETRPQTVEQGNSTPDGLEPGSSYACLAVTDTGTGIDDATQAHIFEPFFTTKDIGEGTGLGLATVHGIVSQSGGHISVSSEPGLGTTFTVYLPAAAGRPTAVAQTPPPRPERLTGTETILVCEDDELVRALLETILTEHGYRVLLAARPEKALELAETHGSTIDVLVSDVVMPQMSGIELVERLSQSRPELRVVLLSGYSPETIDGDNLPPGSSFLQKPFDDIALLQTIRALLDTDTSGTHRPDRQADQRSSY
jgi:PAS domain S-box-containing protein